MGGCLCVTWSMRGSFLGRTRSLSMANVEFRTELCGGWSPLCTNYSPAKPGVRWAWWSACVHGSICNSVWYLRNLPMLYCITWVAHDDRIKNTSTQEASTKQMCTLLQKKNCMSHLGLTTPGRRIRGTPASTSAAVCRIRGKVEQQALINRAIGNWTPNGDSVLAHTHQLTIWLLLYGLKTAVTEITWSYERKKNMRIFNNKGHDAAGSHTENLEWE
jgi:hypothetical protein